MSLSEKLQAEIEKLRAKIAQLEARIKAYEEILYGPNKVPEDLR